MMCLSIGIHNFLKSLKYLHSVRKLQIGTAIVKELAGNGYCYAFERSFLDPKKPQKALSSKRKISKIGTHCRSYTWSSLCFIRSVVNDIISSSFYKLNYGHFLGNWFERTKRQHLKKKLISLVFLMVFKTLYEIWTIPTELLKVNHSAYSSGNLTICMQFYWFKFDWVARKKWFIVMVKSTIFRAFLHTPTIRLCLYFILMFFLNSILTVKNWMKKKIK